MRKGFIRLLSAILMICLLLFAAGGAPLAAGEELWEDDDTFLGEDGDTGDAPAAAEEDWFYTGPAYDYDHLVVGNPTALSGNFTTQMWGYSTSDLDVSVLLNACNLISWHGAEGNFQVNAAAVSGLSVLDDAAGNRTYLLAIRNNLTWSDGTPITAADYAFSILLSLCPQVRSLGGDTENYPGLMGREAFREGLTESLAGVQVPTDHLLSLTVSADSLPFFYELGRLWCYPMPLHLIAPDCTLASGGDGVHMEGPFTADLLRETLLNADHGYVSHPAVVSGPYRLISYAAAEGIAEFEINDRYAGDESGRKPAIQRLTVRPVTNDLMIEELGTGELGLINKCVSAEAIQKGIQLTGSRNFAMATYARTGQSFISLNCEKPALSFPAVRQALSWCLDKDQTVTDYTGSFGLRVDGYYGIAQWMYQVVSGAMGAPVTEPEEASGAAREAYEAELAEWEALSLDGVPVYGFDPEKAAALLEEDGWTLNQQGDAYRPGTDDVRAKRVDGKLIPLDLTLVYPQETALGGILEKTFLPGLRQAGIRLTLTGMEWQQLLRQYYRQEARTCDLMVLASNFNEVFDPAPTFDPADAETGMANYTGIRDPELYALAADLSRTEPGDNLGYMVKWLAFQKRYQEVVPAIPIYGNAYFDFYTRVLNDYEVSGNVTWSEAILSAYLSDPSTVSEAEEAGEQPVLGE